MKKTALLAFMLITGCAEHRNLSYEEQQQLRAAKIQLAQDAMKNLQQMTYRPPIQPVQQQTTFQNPPPMQPPTLPVQSFPTQPEQTHCVSRVVLGQVQTDCQ